MIALVWPRCFWWPCWLEWCYSYLASYPPDVLGVFVIDSSTGAIVVVGSVDFERQKTYSFTVRCGLG